jgi:tRNA-Thr(GGU) m(6)t(6)A37 methyltransferase TsaA
MISMEPIGRVNSPRTTKDDDNWGDVVSTITLSQGIPLETLNGIESFSHIEITFHMHEVRPESICRSSRHPRDNEDWPVMGIFAQRGSGRPNRIGHTIVKLVKHAGRVLTVQGLDAVDGTPVLDIKPVFKELLPREPVTEPEWVQELMKNYF